MRILTLDEAKRMDVDFIYANGDVVCLDKDKSNPAKRCITCNKFIDAKGFCSIECHNRYYDCPGEQHKND